jgi:hypothetical protein
MTQQATPTIQTTPHPMPSQSNHAPYINRQSDLHITQISLLYGPISSVITIAGSLAHNQSSIIDGGKFAAFSALVFTTSQAIARNGSQQQHDSGGRSLWCSLDAQIPL